MFEPYLFPAMATGAATFLTEYLNSRRTQRNALLQNEVIAIQREITSILNQKSCEYCGRLNSFKQNCEGCGAPL